MTTELAKLPLDELLKKFGAGAAKPGSGSAAALSGLMSCQLIRTVISLTRGRARYEETEATLNELSSTIDRLEPTLLRAFEQDSVLFGLLVATRRARDDEKHDQQRRWMLAKQALDDLKEATHVLVEIAEGCLRLAECARTAFDDGFKSARGDSAVAMNFALSGATGALSIIYLNLISFHGGNWETEILRQMPGLELRAAQLEAEKQTRIAKLKSRAAKVNERFSVKPDKLRSPSIVGKRLTDRQIQQIAANIESELWQNRALIWKDNPPQRLIEVLRPEVAITIVGYSFETVASLGPTDDGLLEVAGYIDTSSKRVAVSDVFPAETRHFTAAHELGHALLHDAMGGLHRDRPLDGTPLITARPRIETEADRFAAYFLMPERAVRGVFRENFGTDRFTVDEDTAFKLIADGPAILRDRCHSLRDLSRLLADATYYAGVAVVSMSERFQVSREAMAIRLEELELLQLD